MMISITQKFKPYTRVPGKHLPIPGSLLYAQVFPERWRVFSASHYLLFEGDMKIPGPLKNFAVFQDLHRGGLAVHSECYKYYLHPSGRCEVSPKGLPSASFGFPLLSLGVHKHADWQKIRQRQDLKEILPFWLRLGAMVPEGEEDASLYTLGAGKLLTQVQQSILSKEKTEIVSKLHSLFLSGYSECFLPRRFDAEHQGILTEVFQEDAKVPFALLRKSFSILMEIFVRIQDNFLEILPSLPPEFPYGRLVGVHLPQIGRLSFEWSKKTLRRVVLVASQSTSIVICAGTEGGTCRQREWQGKRLPGAKRLSLGESVEIKAGTTYLWDCFCK